MDLLKDRLRERIVPNYRKGLLAATAVISLAFTASGCAEADYNTFNVDSSQPAKVTETSFTAAHDTVENSDNCAYKPSDVCLVYFKKTVHHPDVWQATLQQCEDGPYKTRQDELCDEMSVGISQASYEQVRVGQIVTAQGKHLTVIPN